MRKPSITVGGQTYEIRDLTGRHWRILSKFIEAAPKITDADFLEKHAAFIADFYAGVTVEDILDLPLDEILPTSVAIRQYVTKLLTAKLEAIEKNSEEGKEQ